ncbi:Lrp/AsnC family transcriptional regulator [Pararhodobacter sp. SW119]|uniref:Lrp/AsnC family transcriptional regulator n=1 Tax=Pararhodobacter sp. SW119 TaxID=2780075 RepID=UPI001AE0B7E7|nr:Lrp/AsnC family transcriptional regulator [Pararhodobacter sp. SW119]
MQLEPRDLQILDLLQRDSRLSNQDLADRVGMSTSACWRRVKALEEAGVIRGYRAEIDPRRAGMAFHAIIHVRLVRHAREIVDRFVAEVMRHDEVQDCYATTGGADYHLRVLCRDLDAFNDFMERTLFQLDGIANIQTNLVLRHIKAPGMPGA